MRGVTEQVLGPEEPKEIELCPDCGARRVLELAHNCDWSRDLSWAEDREEYLREGREKDAIAPHKTV